MGRDDVCGKLEIGWEFGVLSLVFLLIVCFGWEDVGEGGNTRIW